MKRRRRIRGRSRRNRFRRYRHVLHAVLLFLCMVVMGVALGRLIGYLSGYFRSARQTAQLRTTYYEEVEEPETAPATVVAADETGIVPVLSVAPQTTAAPALPTALPESTPDPYATMPPVAYPDNPTGSVRARFTRLHKQNADIVGWITLPDILDTAVVQRDNSYYLRRDYRGYHNENGAIFLDEGVSLASRPYTLILYGHNMKTGAMFGCLRNYEDVGFYRRNPFVTFDSQYEDGRYVIFSVATVGISPSYWNFCAYYRLNDCTREERAEIIRALEGFSHYTCTIDVQPDDQLLLLVTCVEDDLQRRIIAARRLRDGESEAALLEQTAQARTR